MKKIIMGTFKNCFPPSPSRGEGGDEGEQPYFTTPHPTHLPKSVHREEPLCTLKTTAKGRGLWRIIRSLLILLVVLSAIGVIGLQGCAKEKAAARVEVKKAVYTCPMHHQIRKEQPGECPICGMTLVPLENIEETPLVASPQAQGEIPSALKKGPVGGVEGLVSVHMSSYKEQLINVKFATVEKVSIIRLIHTSGRFAGGEGDFASLAGDFAAQRPLKATGRYVVADVYALDIPFVRIGQKVFVYSLSGSGERIPGRVALVYPYDGTQSRVTRVRINLTQAAPPDLFANVDIEASTEPRLCIPPTAVMDTGTQNYVFVATAPGTYSPRRVTLGFKGDDLDEVTSGLKEGEKVVQGANFLIDADSKIKAAFSETK